MRNRNGNRDDFLLKCNIGRWEVYMRFAWKVYEKMVALIQSRTLLVNSMKADFLFVGFNMNTIVQEKTP